MVDNKAVVEYGVVQPHKECSDSDLRRVIEVHQKEKQLRWRLIPRHRTVKHYHTAEEKKDIRHNDTGDKLAKMTTKLPLLEAPKGGVIASQFAMVPHPRQPRNGSWSCLESTCGGTHWTSWLPLKGTRRMTCITWLWGNIPREGRGHRGREDKQGAHCAGKHMEYQWRTG